MPQIGDILVHLSEDSTNRIGTLFQVTTTSNDKWACYNSNMATAHWRDATAEEVKVFNAGGTHINDVVYLKQERKSSGNRLLLLS